MADDVVTIMDAYGIRRAHLVGMSLGGIIAQLAALMYPDCVASLTLMMSAVFAPADPRVPGPDEKIPAYHAQFSSLNWSDAPAVVEYSVGGWRLLSGTAHPFDEDAIRAIAEQDVRRAKNLPNMFNHYLLKGGERWYGKIGEIHVPTLVIHGTDDPALPYERGVALAKTIPGARMITLKGTGHELHHADWPQIAGAILKHSDS